MSCQSAYQSFLAFLDAITSKDIKTSKKLLAKGYTSFGTGTNDIILDLGKAFAFLEREYGQVDREIKYEAELLTCREVSDSLCLLMVLITQKVLVLGQEEVSGPARYSVFMRQERKVWKILHLHTSFPWGVQGEDEVYHITQLEEKNKLLREAVYVKTKQHEKALLDLSNLATIDKLTGAVNRFRFEEVVEQELKRVQRYGDDVSLLIVDIDQYKQVNDSFGHLTGDKVLQQFVKIVQVQLRETDKLARWGGDEFAFLLPKQSLEMATNVAERIRKVVAKHDFGIPLKLTASVGVSQYKEGESFDEWLKRANDLLHLAKETGRDKIVWDEALLQK